MLLALVFRGVAFEYRWRSVRWKPVWNVAFFGGSLVAALMQGIALGALVQGIEVADRAYAGGWWDWLTPFSVLTGIAVTVGYALLGATWLNMKTTGILIMRMRGLAWNARARHACIHRAVVSLWTPFLDPVYFDRWFAWPTGGLQPPRAGARPRAIWMLFHGLTPRADAHAFHRVVVVLRVGCTRLRRHRHQLLSAHGAVRRRLTISGRRGAGLELKFTLSAR
jgi:cytochrome d ubiquinol oxidase subunit II